VTGGRAGDLARRRRAYRLGVSAERIAALWLRLKGYRIVARRHDRGTGEIDLIAQRFGTLAFVEVKARADLASGLDAITATKRRRIMRAAAGYLAAHPEHDGRIVRFDVVVVPARGRPRHLPGAFDATR
jgi:putative endonuclease